MRSILAAFFLITSAYAAQAGVLVELTDGTRLTIESHWSDGDQVHLVRGGVDMIVPKAKIKSIDENAADPEGTGGLGNAEARHGAGRDVQDQPVAVGADAPAEDPGASAEPEGQAGLSDKSAEELEALHVAETDKLLELQDQRFTAKYGGKSADEQKAIAAAFMKQNKRNAAIWFALEKAKSVDAAGAAPVVPAVEQPQ